MGFLVDVERKCKLSIPLKSSTFLITLQRLVSITFCQLRGIAPRFLLNTLAVTRDEDLVLARLVLSARRRSVARVGAWVAA